MGRFNPDEMAKEESLSLDLYVKQLSAYKDMAERIFRMGNSTSSYSEYVLLALQSVIDVAQGKASPVIDKEKIEEGFTKSSPSFQNKFIQFKEKVESKDESRTESEHKNDGPVLGG